MRRRRSCAETIHRRDEKRRDRQWREGASENVAGGSECARQVYERGPARASVGSWELLRGSLGLFEW